MKIPRLLVAFLLLAASVACLVPPPGDVRGWKCDSDEDCLNGLDCYAGICRGPCDSDDDCQVLLNEKCNEDKYCVPPGPICQEGDTQPCYNGPEGTDGKGICKKGTQTCSKENKWGSCQGAVTPKSENDNKCNGVDDNCNGKIDEGLDCQCKKGEKRQCYDGFVGCTKSGDTYTCQGICTPGNQVCGDNSQWGPCQGSKGPESSETCNGQDDNCNGRADENPTDINRSCNVRGRLGPCEKGKTFCRNGTLECVGPPPAVEECNGVDDDCDGKVDNNPSTTNTLTRSCYTGSKGCTKSGGNYKCNSPCQAGYQTCLSAQKTWSQGCTDEKLPATAEKCDGKDEDCDGKVDNDTTDTGKPCKTKLTGDCEAGTTTCDNGKIVCKPDQNNKETCNNKDDDCDGTVDNGSSLCPSGQSCNNGTCS